MASRAATRFGRTGAAALGLALATCSTPRQAPSGDERARIAHVEVNQDGFRPLAIEVRRGAPLTLELVRTTNATCATKVVFPEQQMERELPLGDPVRVEIAADRTRVINFQCGMGMYRGSIVVR